MTPGAPMLKAINDLISIAKVSQLKWLFHGFAIAINPSTYTQFVSWAVKGTKLHTVSFHQAIA